MRDEGLRVGLYYSLMRLAPPGLPAVHGRGHARTASGACRSRRPSSGSASSRSMFAQVRELLTDYGQIDLIWFDGGWERTPEQWQATELERADPRAAARDPDQRPAARARRLRDARAVRPAASRRRGTWETCMTMNESWGYNPRRRALEVGARARAHALRGRRAGRQPAAERRARWATARSGRSTSSGSRRSRRGCRATARAIVGTAARARAVAVLRPVDAKRGERVLPAPADAAVRVGHGARRADPARARGARAARADARSRTADAATIIDQMFNAGSDRRAHDRGARGAARPARDRDRARDLSSRLSSAPAR